MALIFPCLLVCTWCFQSVSISVQPTKQWPTMAKVDEYFWPSGRGHVGHYSTSPYRISPNLTSSLKWTWHDPKGKYFNVPNSANIDENKNIYLTSLDGIRKFTPEGKVLWKWSRSGFEELPDQSSLYNGALYLSTTSGRIIALNMETGEEIWVTHLPSTDGNNGWVTVYEDTVITGSDAPKGADQLVTGLNAIDGKIKWNFKPDTPVWNFMASFAGDGTFTFQDLSGKAYRNKVSDGSLIWKNGGLPGTWTDATSLLGSNGIVYAINNIPAATPGGPGMVSAYNFEDGKLLWNRTLPRPPNNQPAIGKLLGQEELSLVQPIGQQCAANMPTDVYALNARTGEIQWRFKGPTEKDDLQAGDSNLFAQFARKMAGVRTLTKPNPWSAPTIDADGTVFIGSEEGPFYSLRDTNGDGNIEGESEVSTLQTESCFSGSASPAIAPGMMVVANIDTMFVFKD